MMRGIRKFARQEKGSSLVEFALLVPVLMIVLLGSVTAFDLYRNAQNVEKATFTIGDMLSRQTVVTNSVLDGLLSLMQHTVPSAADGGLRVSSVAKKNGVFVVNWSKRVGQNVPTTALPGSIIPDIAEGDTVLLTESFVPHQAMVASFGIGDIVFQGKAAHRPRFVTAIPFQ